MNDHDNDLDVSPPSQVLGSVNGSVTPVPTPNPVVTPNAEEQPDQNPSEEVIDFTDPVDLGQEVQELDISVAQEETRAKIALYFTNFFLAMVAIVVIGPFILNFVDPAAYPAPTEEAKDLLTLLSSVLAGPFGFIVGFYFKQNESGRG